MKRLALPLCCFFSIILAACSSEGGDAKLVGGPCTYNDFGGMCTVTEINKEGDAIFTFNGALGREAVELKDNKANKPMPAGSKVACSIKFIESGTCTPCLFSIGSCGKEAWEAFRSHK